MEDSQFIHRAQELWQRSQERSIVTHTSFLTPAQQHAIQKLPYLAPSLYLFGGQEGTERQIAFFLPDYLQVENFDPSQYIWAFYISCRFGSIGHRDVLGSLLGLGLARWSIGDIYTQGEDGWFFCLPSVGTAIANDLEKVGRNGARVEKVSLEQVPMAEKKREEVKFTVNTLRLDSIVAGTFGLSRQNAVKQIEAGLVQCNYEICEKISVQLVPGDVFSLRGYGKACLKEVGGKSRKEKTYVTVERYV